MAAAAGKKNGKQTRRVGDGTPGPGRPKGVPNKMTIKVRDAIARAFEEVGGAKYLVGVARDDPKTFCALLGKIIPKDVKLEGSLAVTLQDAVVASFARGRESEN